jgi:hypothetical protein
MFLWRQVQAAMRVRNSGRRDKNGEDDLRHGIIQEICTGQDLPPTAGAALSRTVPMIKLRRKMAINRILERRPTRLGRLGIAQAHSFFSL